MYELAEAEEQACGEPMPQGIGGRCARPTGHDGDHYVGAPTSGVDAWWPQGEDGSQHPP